SRTATASRSRSGLSLLHLLEAPTLHDEPARAGMPEVMEAEVVDRGLPARPFKRCSDAAPRTHPVALAEHEAWRFGWPLACRRFGECRSHSGVEGLECVIDGAVHRNLPPAPALGGRIARSAER